MRLRAPLLLCIVLSLPGCTITKDEGAFEANIVQPTNFRAGSGVIISVAVLGGQNLYRLQLQMDSGGSQTVDVDSNRFFQGQAVDLTNDGRVTLVTGTSINEYMRESGLPEKRD